MSAIAFSAKIGPVTLACTVSEKHLSEMEITEVAIESGSTISDHAYMLPRQVTLDVIGQYAAVTYNALVAFQRTRTPFTLVTGLMVYNNMLIKSIDADRDATFSKVLRATVDLKEVVIVNTATVPVDVSDIGSTPPGKPGGAKSVRAASPTPEIAGDATTADRAAGTVQRGDVRTDAVPEAKNESLLSRMF